MARRYCLVAFMRVLFIPLIALFYSHVQADQEWTAPDGSVWGWEVVQPECWSQGHICEDKGALEARELAKALRLAPTYCDDCQPIRHEVPVECPLTTQQHRYSSCTRVIYKVEYESGGMTFRRELSGYQGHYYARHEMAQLSPPKPCNDVNLGPFDGCYSGGRTMCYDQCLYDVAQIGGAGLIHEGSGGTGYGGGFSLNLFNGRDRGAPGCATNTTGFVKECSGSGGFGDDDDDENENGPLGCPDGYRPGEVNGEMICVDAGDDDNDDNGPSGPSGPDGQIYYNGPYACKEVGNSAPMLARGGGGDDFGGTVDIECVFCGVPGTPSCEVAIKHFDKLKKPLDELAKYGKASQKLLEEIRDALRDRHGGAVGEGGGADGSGSGVSGSCTSGFSCDGDPVMCSVAIAAQQRNCAAVDGQSCDGEFSCTGDPVQCAIVAQQRDLNCALNRESDESDLYYEERDKNSEIEGEEPLDLSGSLRTNNALGISGSCPADFDVDFMGTRVTIKMSHLCPLLMGMGYVLMGFGALLAIRIVGVQ